jgi:broad specificity phosphatase PhoE
MYSVAVFLKCDNRIYSQVLLAAEPIDAIFCSPWLRALQTVTPLAAALGLQIRIERGFGEYLPAGEWPESPLPSLMYEMQRESLSRVPAAVLAPDSGSPSPVYPEIVGKPRQGDTDQRRVTVARHAAALGRAFAQAPAGAKTILVVGHGATHDFVADALCGSEHPASHHCDFDGELEITPAHGSLTTLVREGSTWITEAWAAPTVSTETVNNAAADREPTSTVERILVMRHGDRYGNGSPEGGDDPPLTPTGREQAANVAPILAKEGIDALFCSPWIRSLQTAAPFAAASGLPIRVDRGFGEILAYGVSSGINGKYDPAPGLYHETQRDDLPHVPVGLLAPEYGSPPPTYPDMVGVPLAGDHLQRGRLVDRHAAALDRALAAAP